MQTTGGATALMYACQQCMENEVLDLIKKQPNSVKDRDRTSKTPLHYCAENPNTSCSEIVLRAAPELVNAQDDNGYSALHLAVIAGNKALIKLFITKGADVNVHDNEGHSAVHWAVVSSEKEALEMIIRAGANPSTADIHGGYPLHYAVQMCGSSSDHRKNFEDVVRVVETLLNFGVDVNVKDKDGRQPILWAASAGTPEAVIHLVSSGACVEAADKDGLTALHCAASRGHTTTLETLITLCGANVDVIDGNGCSALFYAVTLGHADATELLLQLGAEPNRQDRKGRTPAHCGAAKGQIETLRILQKHGGNLWVRNVKGDIPLHEAVASGRIDLVLWLLSQNPEAINLSNNDGRCPLHIASMYNNTEMVKVLLDSKSLVNPIMRTSKGVLMTPLNVALCKGHRSCGKYLQLHGGVPFSKVARLEPASAFADRFSPSDEMMVRSVETGKDFPPGSQGKIAMGRGSAEIQESQESGKATTSEKKKVYRRRKKKKSASTVPVEDSDSDESIQNVKVNVQGSRKVKKSSGTEESTKVEKVRSVRKGVDMEQNLNDNSHTDSSGEAIEISQETSTANKVTKTRALLTSKSFNETKNVSDLSPEDFPPLMQTINQLDVVMMEADIGEDKAGAEGRSLRVDGAVELTREVVEGNDGEFRVETGPNVRNEENDETGAEVKEDKIEKAAASSQEKSVKTVGKDEEKSADSKGSNSTGEEGLHRKFVKSKTWSNSNSVKKEERFSKSEKTSSASSGGSDKHKKAVGPKSPKAEMADREKAKLADKTKNDHEKIINSERKSANEIREKKNEKPKAQPEIDGLSGGVISTDETRSKLEDFAELKNPGSVDDEETAGGKEDWAARKEDGKEKDLPNDQYNSAVQITELAPSDTLTPKRETEIAAGNENADQIGTEKMEISPAEENPIKASDQLQTSAGAVEQPLEEQNFDVHSSAMPLSEIPPAERDAPNNAEPHARRSEVEANEGESHNPTQTEAAVTEMSNAVEEPRIAAVGQMEDVRPEDDAAKERDDEVSETQNEANSEVHDMTFSKKNDSEDKPAKVTRVSRLCRRHRDFKGNLNDISVTQLVQNTLRKSSPVEVIGQRSDPVEVKGHNLYMSPRQKPCSTAARQLEIAMTIDYDLPSKSQLSSPKEGRNHHPLLTKMFDVNLPAMTSQVSKYHMERGIFYQLLELKRYQIRSGKANEQVLVKRLADEYERSRALLGMKPFSGLYKFREFEKFLYDQLKALNARRSFLIPEIKSYDDIDAMSSFLKKSRYKIINDVPQPETVCTCITQRCHHSACAYTSVPCSGYITDLRRLRCHKTRKEGLFPRIDQPPKSDTDRISGRPPTLELIQGTEKHVISLPQSSPGKGKRYYVTFTIKSGPVFKEEDDARDSKNFLKHRHAKSV